MLKKMAMSLMAMTLTVILGYSASAAEKVLYFIPIVEAGSYWGAMQVGALDKAKELGYTLIVKTSPPAEIQKNEKHIGFLQEAIMQGAAAIAISPMDPDMFDRKVAEAKTAKIPVVTFDADVATKANRATYVGTNNYDAGAILGQSGAEFLKAKNISSGSIALVAVNLSQTTMTDRRKGVKDGFDKLFGADAKNFKWLEPILDEDQSSVSKQQLEGQLVANKDLVAVFSLGSEGPDTGVMEALKSQGRAGKVYHFGFDYTPTWENGIANALIQGIVDQDAYAIGAGVVQAMVDAINGKKLPENIAIPVTWVTADKLVEFGKAKQEILKRK